MTKAAKAKMINEIVAGPRGQVARAAGAEAYIREDGKLCYRDCAKGYARKISFREIIGYMHGEDMRAVLGATR